MPMPHEHNFADISKALDLQTTLVYDIYELIAAERLTHDTLDEALNCYHEAIDKLQIPGNMPEAGQLIVYSLGALTPVEIQGWVGDLRGRLGQDATYEEMLTALREFLETQRAAGIAGRVVF